MGTHDQKISTNTNSISSNTNQISSNTGHIATNAQYVAVCAYQDKKTTWGDITYDSLVTHHSSDSSTIDINTGEFIAGTTGLYTLTFSAYTNHLAAIHAYRDGSDIGWHASYYSKQQDDSYEMGSRTWVMCIKENERVKLMMSIAVGDVYQLTWCVS